MSGISVLDLTKQSVQIQGSAWWSIPDFINWLSRQRVGEPIQSPEFQIKTVMPILVLKFRLILMRWSDRAFSFRIENLTSAQISITEFNIWTVKPERRIVSAQGKFLIGPKSISQEFSSYVDSTMKPGEELNLKINCNFAFYINEDCLARESGSLLQDLSSNLSDPVNPDAVLVCQDLEIPCHRALLSMRSVSLKYIVC